MGLSLNPLDVFKIFQDKKSKNRELVADYLDSIAKEAANLALVWEEVARKVINGDWAGDRETLSRIDKYQLAQNAPYYYRLSSFYEDISNALEGHISLEKRGNIIDHLGYLLMRRNITKDRYESMVSNLKQTWFIDDSNTIQDFSDLARSVEALHKEAAALDVLAKKFRVSGK